MLEFEDAGVVDEDVGEPSKALSISAKLLDVFGSVISAWTVKASPPALDLGDDGFGPVSSAVIHGDAGSLGGEGLGGGGSDAA